MKSSKVTSFSSVLIVVLILAAYVLPYTIMTTINAWYGSFLLWGMIGALIIVLNVIVTRDWRG